MAKIAVVRIPSRLDDFNIPADDLLIGENGELSVLKYEDPDDTDTVRVMAVFSSYEYAVIEDDGEDEEEDYGTEVERSIRILQLHGYVIDTGDDDDDDDDEEDEDDEDEDEEARAVHTTVDISEFSANGHDGPVDASPDAVLVPVEVSVPPADDSAGPGSPSLS